MAVGLVGWSAAPVWLVKGIASRDGLVYLADSVAGVTVWRLLAHRPAR